MVFAALFRILTPDALFPVAGVMWRAGEEPLMIFPPVLVAFCNRIYINKNLQYCYKITENYFYD